MFVAVLWDFYFVCGLPLCWRWQNLIVLRLIIFDRQTFFSRKCCFVLFKRKPTCKKVIVSGQWNFVSISTRTAQTREKNCRSLGLLGMMLFQYLEGSISMTHTVISIKQLYKNTWDTSIVLVCSPPLVGPPSLPHSCGKCRNYNIFLTDPKSLIWFWELGVGIYTLESD